ncbi:MAG: glycosyltransferase family 2 protein [Ginsengibacter sp.]
MHNKLAIIIPAFKARYFNRCLQSIASQTNRNFTVYIGDDASVETIERIVARYKGSFPLVYKRFTDNVGKHSLVSHWNRCLSIISHEKWVWLFADDDFMAPDCVSDFFKTVEKYPNGKVYRFNLEVADKNLKTFRSTLYPELETAENFFLRRMALQYDSSISNYIFSAERLITEGFVELPLAWGSDDATIIRVAKESPIIRCDSSTVSWRISDLNISSQGDLEFIQKKTEAKVEFIKWVYQYSKFKTLQERKTKLLVLNWIIGPIKNPSNNFSPEKRKKLLKEIERALEVNIQIFLLKKKFHYRVKHLLSRF